MSDIARKIISALIKVVILLAEFFLKEDFNGDGSINNK